MRKWTKTTPRAIQTVRISRMITMKMKEMS